MRGCCCGCCCAQQAIGGVAGVVHHAQAPPIAARFLDNRFSVFFCNTPLQSVLQTVCKASMRLDDSIIRLCKKCASNPSQWPPPFIIFPRKQTLFLRYLERLRGPAALGTLCAPHTLAGVCAVWITCCAAVQPVLLLWCRNRSIRGLLRYKMQAPPPTLQQDDGGICSVVTRRDSTGLTAQVHATLKQKSGLRN
jgi:hypothetical protein